MKLFDCIRTMFLFAMLPMFRPLQCVPGEKRKGLVLISLYNKTELTHY